MENKVLALVNGREITEKDLQDTIMRIPPQNQGYYQSEAGKNQLLEQIISFELFYNYGINEGFQKDEVYLKQVEQLKKEILTQYAINKVLTSVQVSEEEVKEYYNENKDNFKNEEAVTAKHILVDSEEKANEVLESIKSGKSFEEAAEEFSSCPSKAQGGNLGSFTRGKMVPEFEKAAFSLQVGKISEPVKTQFGYHIIKVEDKKEASLKEYEEVRENLQRYLLEERQKEKYVRFNEELKNKYKVEMK